METACRSQRDKKKKFQATPQLELAMKASGVRLEQIEHVRRMSVIASETLSDPTPETFAYSVDDLVELRRSLFGIGTCDLKLMAMIFLAAPELIPLKTKLTASPHLVRSRVLLRGAGPPLARSETSRSCQIAIERSKLARSSREVVEQHLGISPRRTFTLILGLAAGISKKGGLR